MSIYEPMIQKEGNIVQYSHRFWGTQKIVRLIKMCLNEMYSKVQIGKNLSDNIPVQNCLKQRDTLLPLF
jgi:hypothetical protein